MSQLRGKLRQKDRNGPFYYRLMVSSGQRKEFSLKTCDYEEACRKAAELDAVLEAPTQDVAIAQITAIKGFSKQAMNLPLTQGWEKYQVHPNRATPHTVSEQLAYKRDCSNFNSEQAANRMSFFESRRASAILIRAHPEMM